MSSYVPTSYIRTPPVTQVMYGLLIVTITVVLAFTIELLYNKVLDTKKRFQTLVDYTANPEDMSIIIHQDASKFADAKPIGLSMNERTGIEFSYSFYLNVFPSTFTGSNTYKHVFHKGYYMQWPLMAPGVFINGATNTMRVIMNTYKNPFTYVDIKNIPVQKWFHVVLNSYKGGLDVFINGNLANRISFKDTLPYQNFQDVILFSNANINTLNASGIPTLDKDFHIEGSFKGYLSNLIYARYALSVTEIQTLMNNGPSSKVKAKNMELPPYMGDDWWSNSR